MKPSPFRRNARYALVTATLAGTALMSAVPAQAGGISLYEVGTTDVGLASAGYTARAQDASTVFTNPAGMTRLEGSQLTLGAQMLYGDLGFSIGAGTSPELGSNTGGNPVGWFPGGGMFYSYSVSPDLKLGFAATGNFGLAQKYDAGWVGRYHVQESTLLGMSLLPSVAYRINPQVSVGASLNAMYGIFKTVVAVNNIVGADGQLKVDNRKWGFGGNLGVMYEPSATTRFGLTYTSQVKLGFSAPAEFSGISPGLEALLKARGLFNSTLDVGVNVPQGVNGSFYTALDDRWAVLGSVGWQQWSRFGEVRISVDASNPINLTTALDFKDTWHVAAGAQYRMSGPWLLNAGIAYDSSLQDTANISPSLPSGAQWRFGVGAQKEESKTFNWGVSAEYVYGGTLDTSVKSLVPVAAGGRGDLIGSFNNTNMIFLAANFNWKF